MVVGEMVTFDVSWSQLLGVCAGLFFLVMVVCLVSYVVIRFRQTKPQERKR